MNSIGTGKVTWNDTGSSPTRWPVAVPIWPLAVTLTSRPGPTPIGPTSITRPDSTFTPRSTRSSVTARWKNSTPQVR